MKPTLVFLAGLTALALSGCTTIAQDADEFRAIQGQAFGYLPPETVVVNRPYGQVANVLRSNAKDCFDLEVRSGSWHGHMYIGSHNIYRPSIRSDGNSTEIVVQQGGQESPFQPPPEGGYYIFVADAYPMNSRTTQLDVYATMSSEDMAEAVKRWADGTTTACPVLY